MDTVAIAARPGCAGEAGMQRAPRRRRVPACRRGSRRAALRDAADAVLGRRRRQHLERRGHARRGWRCSSSSISVERAVLRRVRARCAARAAPARGRPVRQRQRPRAARSPPSASTAAKTAERVQREVAPGRGELEQEGPRRARGRARRSPSWRDGRLQQGELGAARSAPKPIGRAPALRAAASRIG